MNGPLPILAWRTVFWCIFIPAMLWPALALAGRCVAQGEPPDGGFTFSIRQLGLLWHSIWLSGCATMVCLVVSLPSAFAVGRGRSLTHRPWLTALMMALLLCPPTVYAFGWERLLPARFNPDARCILVWALWAWPIPAMIIGAGWSRIGAAAYEAALMVASPAAAFFHVVLPILRRHVALSALILFVLFFNDYGVPHACGLLVYATELLGWVTDSTRSIDTVWPGLWSVAITVLALAGVFVAWRRCISVDDVDFAAVIHPWSGRGLRLTALTGAAVTWLLPIGALACRLASPRIMVAALRTYGFDLAWTLSLAGIAGVASVAMGLGLVAAHRMRALAVVFAIGFGALPGALIGGALVAGYNHAAFAWVYDHWPIVMLCYVSRFGWIGVLTGLLVARSTPPHLVDQARVDGATRASVIGRIQIPMNWPTLLCGAAVVAALSVADVAASKLVRVPGFTPIAHVLMEKFHRFEDGMLISLSLWLVAATIPPILLWMLAIRRSRLA